MPEPDKKPAPGTPRPIPFVVLGAVLTGLFALSDYAVISLAHAASLDVSGNARMLAPFLHLSPVLLMGALIVLWRDRSRPARHVVWLLVLLGAAAFVLAMNMRWMRHALSSA